MIQISSPEEGLAADELFAVVAAADDCKTRIKFRVITNTRIATLHHYIALLVKSVK